MTTAGQIESEVAAFFEGVATGMVDIYNEFSFQHELGFFLRQRLGANDALVQFERPVGSFGFQSHHFCKREIDIVVVGRTTSFKAAIELKFPRSGQYPEQMFKACEDIAFLEQLTAAGFNAGFFVMAADDHLLHEGPDKTGIYSFFRAGQQLTGTVTKPTGRRDLNVVIVGKYSLCWRVAGSLRYLCVPIAQTASQTAVGGSR